MLNCALNFCNQFFFNIVRKRLRKEIFDISDEDAWRNRLPNQIVFFQAIYKLISLNPSGRVLPLR